MTIERKILINDKYYYLGIELKYGKNNILTKADGSYFDMGDLSIMIDDVESKHEKESKKLLYDESISYMNDILYLYDRFPFVSYIKNISYNSKGEIVLIGCITKDDIIDYIKTNQVEMNRWDKNNCRCPLLYN